MLNGPWLNMFSDFASPGMNTDLHSRPNVSRSPINQPLPGLPRAKSSPMPPVSRNETVGFMSRFLSHYNDSFSAGAMMPKEFASYGPTRVAPRPMPPAPTQPPMARAHSYGSSLSRFLSHSFNSNFEDALMADELFGTPEPAPQAKPVRDNQITEFAIGLVTQKHALLNKNIKVGKAGAIGLKIEETLHRSKDSSIQQDPTRRATTQKITSSGKDVVWAEAVGVAELGTGKSGTISLGNHGKANAGFSASSLVRYRTIQPVTLGEGQTVDDVRAGHQLGIPTDADHLIGIAPGTEFELQGKGTVTGKASVGVGKYVGPSLANLGASASANASIKYSGEVALNIKVLDEQGLVQVTLSDVDAKTAQASAALHAGLKSTLSAPPAIGKGMLKHLIEDNLLKPFTGSLNNLASTTAEVSGSSHAGSREVGTYTLDVSCENGLKAYKSLLALHTESADALSQVTGSGVRSMRMTDLSQADEFKAKITFGGKRLLLHHSLTEEREGRLRTSDNTGLVYRENKFSKESSNVISGSKQVTWDAVSVQESDEGKTENFCNMKFKAKNLFTHDGAVGRFFRFSDALGVEQAGQTQANQPEVSVLDKLLTNKDDTEVDVDIYFTQAGLDNIREAGVTSSRQAYYQARKDIDPQLAGLESLEQSVLAQAEDMAKRYVSARDESAIENSGGQFAMLRLESNYHDLTGRDIRQDYQGLSGGKDFVRHLGSLSESSGDAPMRTFFASLGETTEFQYMPAIAALTTLAGKDETLVNNLAMTGENVHINAISEGVIEHPAKTMAKLVNLHQLGPRPEGSPV